MHIARQKPPVSMNICLHALPACDRRMDGQTDRQMALPMPLSSTMSQLSGTTVEINTDGWVLSAVYRPWRRRFSTVQ